MLWRFKWMLLTHILTHIFYEERRNHRKSTKITENTSCIMWEPVPWVPHGALNHRAEVAQLVVWPPLGKRPKIVGKLSDCKRIVFDVPKWNTFFILVGGLEHLDYFFHILGMSSSQLTFIFFRGVGLNHQPVLLNAIHFWVVQCGSVQWFQKITRKINGLVEWVLIIPNYCTMFEDSPGFPISVAQIPRLVYHRINPDGALWFSCSLQRSKSHRMQTYVYIEIHIHQCVWDGWREFAYSWWHPHDFLKPP